MGVRGSSGHLPRRARDVPVDGRAIHAGRVGGLDRGAASPHCPPLRSSMGAFVDGVGGGRATAAAAVAADGSTAAGRRGACVGAHANVARADGARARRRWSLDARGQGRSRVVPPRCRRCGRPPRFAADHWLPCASGRPPSRRRRLPAGLPAATAAGETVAGAAGAGAAAVAAGCRSVASPADAAARTVGAGDAAGRRGSLPPRPRGRLWPGGAGGHARDGGGGVDGGLAGRPLGTPVGRHWAVLAIGGGRLRGCRWRRRRRALAPASPRCDCFWCTREVGTGGAARGAAPGHAGTRSVVDTGVASSADRCTHSPGVPQTALAGVTGGNGGRRCGRHCKGVFALRAAALFCLLMLRCLSCSCLVCPFSPCGGCGACVSQCCAAAPSCRPGSVRGCCPAPVGGGSSGNGGDTVPIK